MEVFGVAKIVKLLEAPSSEGASLGGRSGGPSPENFEKSALSLHLSAFQGLNLKNVPQAEY